MLQDGPPDALHEETLIEMFDLDPEYFPWRPPIAQEIEDRRVKMSDTLIFDILLSSGGVRHGAALYPPTDAQTLKRLLDAIEESTYDTLKQDCLVYFLLKWHRDGRESVFKDLRSIPPQFVALADAYWHLDSGIDISRAVCLLSDARLNRDYTSKILQALSLADNPNPLIRKYVHTARPLLTEPDDIDAYTIALVDGSFMEAWQYQRTFSEKGETRERLVRKILGWCLDPFVLRSAKPRSTPLKQLLAFPLSGYEEELLHSYAIEPPSHLPPSSVPVVQDLVCLRLVQAGRYAAAVKLERQLSARVTQKAGDKYHKAAQERRQMVDDIMAAMPVAERQLLEVELEELARGKGTGRPSLSMSWSAKVNSNLNLDASWESVRAPTVSANGGSSFTGPRLSTNFGDSHAVAIPHRSGAPRFGGPLPEPSSTAEMLPPILSTSASHVPGSAPVSASQALPLFGSSISGMRQEGHVGLPGSSMLQSSTSRAAQSSSFGIPTNARTGSLFDTVGSANQTPNAFYQPPISVSAGMTRSFGQDTSKTPLSSSQQFEGPSLTAVEDMLNGDVEMETDEKEVVPNGHADASHSNHDSHENGESAPQFTASIFNPISSASAGKPQLSPPESRSKVLPGAFDPDSDEDSEPAPPTPTRKSRRQQPALRPRSPSPPPLRTPRRTARTHKPITKERDLSRSIPGALMDEEEEEEDELPPLPPTTPAARRSTRKSRAPRGSNNDDMTEAELTRRPRRSTRLSTVSSVGSSSPEPPSPQKPPAKTRSSRKSVAGSTAASKATSRRKR
ncbi:uncharacterized protein FIBRA_01604 [Fibroporia radiculosa]|uniref:ELYS-like domain-containing protein n=1 Tax=Fibroporia radiculosa TaxID=599839 RepID=J4I8K8_9APHY|nr:uncharacterized protein FIBRA_01604 [Fibroporia radiculosa]CCL99586.1 predicted protein [Fibroporia radiculosa]